MDIQPIKTEADYAAALQEIEGLMEAVPDTPGGDRLDVLVTLVEAYEASIIRSPTRPDCRHCASHGSVGPDPEGSGTVAGRAWTCL